MVDRGRWLFCFKVPLLRSYKSDAKPTCGHLIHCVRPVGSRSFKIAIEAKRADTSQRRSPQPKGQKNATPKIVIIADAAAKITEVISGTQRGRKKWAVHNRAIRKKMADSPRHHGSSLLIPASPEVTTAAIQPMITSATTATAIRPEATRKCRYPFSSYRSSRCSHRPDRASIPLFIPITVRSQRAAPKASLDGYWLNIQRRSR